MKRTAAWNLPVRPRRNRRSSAIRSLVQETQLSVSDLILPAFVHEEKISEPIGMMPGVERLSPEALIQVCQRAFDRGIPAVALFPALPESKKNPQASESSNSEGLLPTVVRRIKDRLPELAVITDVAMDPYSSDGHDGLVRDGKIVNDPSLEILAEMSLCQAKAGADLVAPSDMMDGRVGFIRKALDESGFSEVGILSYAVKYASSFYGPFREALQSAPKSGDKKTYQMDPANVREAFREVDLDIQEGADIVMVKPALPYLDVLARLRERTNLPLAAYQVSGEYAMLQFAGQSGAFDRQGAILESLLSIKRAGADCILTYFALEAADLLG